MLLMRFAVPSAVATVSGIGLDLMGNILPAWWPDAPHYVWTGLFVMSSIMIAAFPAWLIWAGVQRFRGMGETGPAELAYLRHKDSELGPAIIEMSRKSAWGKCDRAKVLEN